MRGGHLDVMTIPFTLEGQTKRGVATYIGPLTVRDTGTNRGWGVFLTRDVRSGEVLIIERPVAACWVHPDDPVLKQMSGEGLPDHGISAALTYLVQTPGADADGQIAARLATLSSRFGPRWALTPPSDAALRGEEMLQVPPMTALSARQIRGIAESNCHRAIARCKEATTAQRRPLKGLLDPASLRQFAAVQAFNIQNRGKVELLCNTRLQKAAMIDLLNALAGVTQSLDKAHAFAEAARSPSILKQLLSTMSPAQIKAELDVQNSNGATALHLAVEYGRREDVDALLAAGANPNIFDKRGLMPLHLAASKRCNAAILTALLDAGADVNAVSPGSKTPLELAVIDTDDHSSEAAADVLRTLLARGADPRMCTEAGDVTVLDLLYAPDSDTATIRAMLGLTHDKGLAKLAAFDAAGFTAAAYAADSLSATGLYWVTSFINHDVAENTWRCTLGGTMVVVARHNMTAGTELTSGYSINPEDLRLRGV